MVRSDGCKSEEHRASQKSFWQAERIPGSDSGLVLLRAVKSGESAWLGIF